MPLEVFLRVEGNNANFTDLLMKGSLVLMSLSIAVYLVMFFCWEGLPTRLTLEVLQRMTGRATTALAISMVYCLLNPPGDWLPYAKSSTAILLLTLRSTVISARGHSSFDQARLESLGVSTESAE